MSNEQRIEASITRIVAAAREQSKRFGVTLDIFVDDPAAAEHREETIEKLADFYERMNELGYMPINEP